jgi:hypothetical protein
VTPGNSDSITVTINTTGLANGDYSAEIVISNNDLDGNPKIVPVTLHVRPTLTWNCPLGGQALIAPNPGAGRPFLSVDADPTGITVAPAGEEVWGIYWLDETTGDWLYYIPGFGSTLTMLETDQYYFVVVSGACDLIIPQ